jgi:hypothetical protein
VTAQLLSVVPRASRDLAAQLRKLADAVDAGQVVDFVSIHTEGSNEAIGFTVSASRLTAIALSAILHQHSIDAMRK